MVFQAFLIAVLILAVALAALYMRDHSRMQQKRFDLELEKERFEQHRRAEIEDRQFRREEFERQQFHSQNFFYLADHVEDDPTATAGDYLTFEFDLGPQVAAGDYADAVYSALKLPQNLALIGGYKADDIEVRVHRASYENPMSIILLVMGLAAAVTYIMTQARKSNDQWQIIRTTTAEGDTVVAAEKFKTQVLERASEALEAAEDDDRERVLRAITDVARAVTEHDLLDVNVQQVGQPLRVKPTRRLIRTTGSPKQLGPGSGAGA